jgi:predicted MFS family arabinose efflux permease
MGEIRVALRTPVGRGFALIALATVATGFAMAANQNIGSNFFKQELHLSGPQFGYITAIREIPGFLLIFLTAIFYRLTLPRLTALALAVLAIGYGFYGFATSFWTLAPWVIISSMGYHTWLQTQGALGMSLTTKNRAGSILGRVSALNSAGAVTAMLVVLVAFSLDWLTFRSTFVICGLLALLAAVAIFFFPNLRDGEEQAVLPKREPILFRREYRNYYLLNLLDGGRQQIFFSFGLWVLVEHYKLGVPLISGVLLAVTAMNMTLGPWIGRQIDRRGVRRILEIANVGYIVALLGYGFADNESIAIGCYVIYSFIFPLSYIGSSTYLRQIAPPEELAPSLAMGVTMQHVAAIVVPLAAGYILNFVGYQIPFIIACGFAATTFLVTRRLSPETQQVASRLAPQEAVAD